MYKRQEKANPKATDAQIYESLTGGAGAGIGTPPMQVASFLRGSFYMATVFAPTVPFEETELGKFTAAPLHWLFAKTEIKLTEEGKIGMEELMATRSAMYGTERTEGDATAWDLPPAATFEKGVPTYSELVDLGWAKREGMADEIKYLTSRAMYQ